MATEKRQLKRALLVLQPRRLDYQTIQSSQGARHFGTSSVSSQGHQEAMGCTTVRDLLEPRGSSDATPAEGPEPPLPASGSEV